MQFVCLSNSCPSCCSSNSSCTTLLRKTVVALLKCMKSLNCGIFFANIQRVFCTSDRKDRTSRGCCKNRYHRSGTGPFLIILISAEHFQSYIAFQMNHYPIHNIPFDVIVVHRSIGPLMLELLLKMADHGTGRRKASRKMS